VAAVQLCSVGKHALAVQAAVALEGVGGGVVELHGEGLAYAERLLMASGNEHLAA